MAQEGSNMSYSNMPYKGEDLDLRTPQGWGPAGRDAPPGSEPNWWTRTAIYKGGRADPIWVDDSVLACCNHAFDLAVAHRAPEVRLEHYINAMTLNDAVALQMESRGIGVGQLRRESGLILANEPPAAGLHNGRAHPKRSEGLEEALRLAADRAYPRRTPVTIDDMLHVLFDVKKDLPGLLRHATARAGRDGASRPGVPNEPGLFSAAGPDTYAPRQTYPYPDETGRHGLAERLDALEDAMHRARAEAAQLTPAIFDRIGAVERTIDLRLVEMARHQPTAAALTDRIATIERVLDQRIGEIGRNWVAVGERLQALELSIRRPPEAILPPLVAARLETLGGVEQKLDGLERAFSVILDRLSGLERQIGAVQTRIVDLAPEPFVRRWGER